MSEECIGGEYLPSKKTKRNSKTLKEICFEHKIKTRIPNNLINTNSYKWTSDKIFLPVSGEEVIIRHKNTKKHYIAYIIESNIGTKVFETTNMLNIFHVKDVEWMKIPK